MSNQQFSDEVLNQSEYWFVDLSLSLWCPITFICYLHVNKAENFIQIVELGLSNERVCYFIINIFCVQSQEFVCVHMFLFERKWAHCCFVVIISV